MGLFRRQRDPLAETGLFRSVKRREHKRMRERWQWILLVFLVLLAAGGGYVARLYFGTQGEIQQDIPGVAEPLENEPFNALLVGSDSRRGLTPEEQIRLGAKAVEGERADTLILAHIDPKTNHVIMVQFPRDLWVPVAGHGTGKINSALAWGPGVLVETIERLAGVEINSYAQVNIAGFKELVDAIDGVDVCVSEPIPFDPQTGIEITPEEVGMVAFDGERALRFVRSRNFPSGDFGRIQNQQKFLAAAIGKLMSVKTLLRPDRVRKALGVARKHIRIDTQSTIRDLVSLARRFRTFNPEDYEVYVAPTRGGSRIGGASVVLPDPVAMRVMFRAIRRNLSPAGADEVPEIDPSTVRVGVYNGTFADGVAHRAARKLREATRTPSGSLAIGPVANADRFDYKRHVIMHRPRAEAMARLVAAVVPGARLEPGRIPSGVDVAVIVGSRRFVTERLVQVLPLPIPAPSAPPPECR